MSDLLPIKKDIDTWLNEVSYQEINHGNYTPSEFSLLFMNFIKLVNGKQGESNKTPPIHLKMLDKLISPSDQIANLCFRGAAKTTLFFEYLVLFLGVFGALPGFGDISGMMYISDSMENGVKAARKNVEFRYNNSEFLQTWITRTHFTDNYLEFENSEGHLLGCKMFGAKTGLRGTKIFGKRPVLAVMDDLISDDDARSQTAMDAIKDTVFKGVNYALDPTRNKKIFNGTPFNKEDILIEAVESGAWDVNVWPVCEAWPCSREEFEGAWEDRFSYDYVKKQYDNAVLNGKVAGFMQELMLRISSEEERLVQDNDIIWYNRNAVLTNKSMYNFYITSDFATSESQRADFSVISVWAYSPNGDFFWVDGICKRQTIDKSFDDLFRLVQMYSPMSVGIEVTGQQQAFIKFLQNEMMNRNIWFNFASSEKSGTPGIRPVTNKLSRFNQILPQFKMKKIWWPDDLKTSEIMGHFIGQLKLATINGLKGKDDCIDTISMLSYMNPWKPTAQVSVPDPTNIDHWGREIESETYSLHNYVV